MDKIGFFKEFWAEFDVNLNNWGDGRWRVCDDLTGLEEWFLKRGEGNANGLVLINTDIDVFDLKDAVLYMELWGGHPGTNKKRVSINGRGIYDINDPLTEEGYCNYTFYELDFRRYHLVKGVNALQFSCDRGTSFMAHYMMDSVALRTFIKDESEVISKNGLDGFSAEVVSENGSVLGDDAVLFVNIPSAFDPYISSIDLFGQYFDYDDNQRGEYAWRGHTKNKAAEGHIGTIYDDARRIIWDTMWIPNQEKPMAVKACINFTNGFKYMTKPLYGLSLNPQRHKVTLHLSDVLPKDFWSRDNKSKQSEITLPDISDVSEAKLVVKAWDGGEGNVENYFTVNDKGYKIVSGKANHRLIFTNTAMDLNDLKSGINTVNLMSDTKEHGIEITCPGPGILLRSK